MKRLLVLVLLLSACGGGGTEATARPAIVQPRVLPVDAAIAPILAAPARETGVITFGVAYDPDTLGIAKPLTRFKRTYPEIAWGAHLSRGVAASYVTWTVAMLSDTGVETTVFSVEEPIDGADVTVLANSGNLALLVGNQAGTYVMRYLHAREVLAEGTFTLVK
jgi:hypothetical protein